MESSVRLQPSGVVLPNRLCKASTSEHMGSVRGNEATPLLCSLYKRWSLGGFGLVITGNVMVDRRAPEAPRNVALDDASDERRTAAWAEACKVGGSVALVQLSHAGRQSPLAASWARPRAIDNEGLRLSGVGAQLHRTPRVATASEVADVVAAFARAATLAVAAGFDGVQIHAAHGYFLSQCVSVGRVDVLFAVARAVRAATPDAVVSVKINAYDGGSNVNPTAVADLVVALGRHHVDLVELSNGGSYATGMRCLGDAADFAAVSDPVAATLDVLDARTDTVPTILVAGGIVSRQDAARLLERRPHLVVGVARAACVAPDLPRFWLQGHELPAAPPQPPPFFRATTDRLPVAIRRIFIPGIRFGWYARQLKRLARGLSADPAMGHAYYLLAIFPRALFFEPLRLFAVPSTRRLSGLGWALSLLAAALTAATKARSSSSS